MYDRDSLILSSGTEEGESDGAKDTGTPFHIPCLDCIGVGLDRERGVFPILLHFMFVFLGGYEVRGFERRCVSGGARKALCCGALRACGLYEMVVVVVVVVWPLAGRGRGKHRYCTYCTCTYILRTT